MHRNNVVGDKLKYYDRQREALESNGATVSFIFDAMSKDKTRLPIMGNEASLDHQFTNNTMGCISHVDKETRFYTSYGSVQTGASLMIHCIHLEVERLIDKRKAAGEALPTKIYLQIDGASDNTAYAVMASLEHLVAMDLVHTIEIWRLPVGHTHEVSSIVKCSLYLKHRTNTNTPQLSLSSRILTAALVPYPPLSAGNIFTRFQLLLNT